MRLFVGIELPDTLKSQLEHQLLPLQENPKGLVMPHDYHLTLLFIGAVEIANIPDFLKRLREITFAPFKLELTGIRFFGRRIMYVKCMACLEIIHLKKMLRASSQNSCEMRLSRLILISPLKGGSVMNMMSSKKRLVKIHSRD